ncbi:MAG: hypothetical protein J6W61_02080 [Bacteroidales bacterium]|nr:hypothetical protein [Bacteroidales bacterium]
MIRTIKKFKDKCVTISEHYGLNTQEWQTAQELFELGQVVTRRAGQRGRNWKEKLLDELADVYIMIQQLLHLHGISKADFEAKVEEKLDRQLERIKNGD